MELSGKVIAVLPANSGVSQRTGNAWMSQEYVIEVPGQYPRKCMFRIFGEDRIKQFNIQMGEDITVSFDIDAGCSRAGRSLCSACCCPSGCYFSFPSSSGACRRG